MNMGNQAAVIGVERQAFERYPSTENLRAEIVIIDVSSMFLNPQAYEVSFSSKGAPTMMGEVLSIDHNKKQIFLKNQCTLFYKHLIFAKNLLQISYHKHLIGAVKSLLDAQKIQDIELFVSVTPFQQKKIVSTKKQHIDQPLHYLIKSFPIALKNTLDILIARNKKHLFVVQI